MIYLLEDDGNIRKFVLYALKTVGIEAEGFELPSEFWRAMKEAKPELVLLDIMLPEEDGLSVLKKLRGSRETENIPVIMLTALDTEYDKVVGLDSGADDYISKPFGTMELVSRIKAVLRRTSSAAQGSGEYRVGDLYVNPSKHIVKVKGQNVSLSFKEFELLCALMENPGTVLSREHLFLKVWGYAFDGENRTLDVHIRTLRAKLGECGSLIETVRGMGYKIGETE